MTADAIQYPSRLQLANLPTPLQPLDRLSRQLGGPRIWVKRDDQTGCGVSGNKVRKLEFSLAQALAEGCDTVITCGGLQSNHCRATAILCAQLGLSCHLILRGAEPDEADGNLLLDKLTGATISYYSLAEYQSSRDALFAQWRDHYAAQGHKAFCIPTGASDEIGLWGYIAACEELRADFAAAGIAPQHIVCATGSGGTHGGLLVGNALHGLGATVWGINVCDDARYFSDKVTEDVAHWRRRYRQTEPQALSVPIIEGYVGPGYGRATREVFDTIRDMARLEGLLLDPVYTGKAFHGMLTELERGRFGRDGDIVFIHTGGLFGLFPQKQQLEL